MRADGIRVRSGALSVAFLPGEDPEVTQVAYAITKRVGGAVERNRLRRRLRAILEEVARDPDGLLPRGVLVISAGPRARERGPQELKSDVERLLAALASRRGGGAPR